MKFVSDCKFSRFVELLDWMVEVSLRQSIIDICLDRFMICLFLLKAKRFEFSAGGRIMLLTSAI
jgi:hypothetical protein